MVTGYGKNLLKISRHHRNPGPFPGGPARTGLDHFILLEVGGQDTKVLYVKDGRVFDFLTNDRCAAGTGRYLENMARFLKMPLTQFAGAWQDPVEISQTCAIFGESELVGHLLEGVDPERIAAGVNASVARRALAMVRRYRCPTLVCVGGRGPQPGRDPFSPGPRIFGCWCRRIPNSTAPWAAAWRRPGGWRGSRRDQVGAGDPLARALGRLAGSRGRCPAPGRRGARRAAALLPGGLPLHLPRRARAVVGKFFSAYPPQAPADQGLAQEYDNYLQLPALGLTTAAA